MKYEKSMLLEVIGDSPENRIIDFLIEGKGMDYSKTDIADGCDLSRPTVYKILPKLLDKGIIMVKRKVGRITLFQLNEENERVKALIKLEEILLNESFEAIKSKGAAPAPQ
jgi:DNA-binding transcriptional ArsR family regulator